MNPNLYYPEVFYLVSLLSIISNRKTRFKLNRKYQKSQFEIGGRVLKKLKYNQGLIYFVNLEERNQRRIKSIQIERNYKDNNIKVTNRFFIRNSYISWPTLTLGAVVSLSNTKIKLTTSFHRLSWQTLNKKIFFAQNRSQKQRHVIQLHLLESHKSGQWKQSCLGQIQNHSNFLKSIPVIDPEHL